GNEGSYTFNGGAGDDLFNGGDGNDVLNGWTGADTMSGGAGDDIYVVDNSNDVIYEAVNDGNDVVISNASYSLGGNLENLTLTENSNIDGTGNNSDNRITGNGGNNKLNGGNGDDVVVGNAGTDTLIGASGNDILNGGGGDDSLIGHAGSDRFLYNTGSSFNTADVGEDIIADFNKTENDKIVLSKTTFDSLNSSTGFGFSVVAEFEVVTSDTAAATSDASIVYNSNNGKLFYNPDGSAAGFGGGGLFATLNNNAQLTANDFVLQS
ncbi:MAG: calcium-binding protein, partial [Okeania sp. SIO2H7]|nr:calcium-binding protein [Okeania sp. SIO2H7]